MANRETDMAIKRQRFLDAAFTLFAEKGIEAVSLESVAQASGFGIATLYRHFSNKVTLVVELAAQKWEEYIQYYNSTVSRERIEEMTGAEYLKCYLDSFLDLYRHHKDILRFNYDLNSFLRKESHENGQMERYMTIVDQLGAAFHELYERGVNDGTLKKNISEKMMFSSTFHIMLAAVTRYTVGLVYVFNEDEDPERELIMLENMILREFTEQP